MTFYHTLPHSLLRKAICLMLSVIAWNGPIPVLHSHEAYADGSALLQHLAKFHSSAEESELPGAHWHFAYVDDLTGDFNSAATAYRNRAFPLLVAKKTWKPADGQIGCPGYDLTRQPALLALDPQHLNTLRNAPRSFLSSLLCDVPLVAITGVCLN